MNLKTILALSVALCAGQTMQAQFECATNADGTGVTITGYIPVSGGVNIPTNINGLPVTSIGNDAFADDQIITSVVIPFGVTSIGNAAFASCTSLTSITIPDSITSIGQVAFVDCFSLTAISIPTSVTSIAETTPVAAEAGLVFCGCANLTAITVDTNNPVYSSVNGVLFNKSQTVLIECPGTVAGNYAIPSGVTTVGDFAFEECDSLTTVAVPSSVTSIGDYAFYECGDLTGIYFAGNAPAANSTAALGEGNATAYYLPGTTGWNSTFAGCLAVMWLPPPSVIQTTDGGFGIRNNKFGFNISGPVNVPVVLEACTNLANPVWTSLLTARLTNGSFYFSEPLQTNVAGRYYRIGWP